MNERDIPDRIRWLEEQAKAEEAEHRKAVLDDGQPQTMSSIADGVVKSFARLESTLGGVETPEDDPKFRSSPNRTLMSMQLAEHQARLRLGASTGFKAADIEALISLGRGYCLKAISVCESPIEEALVPWMVFYDFAGIPLCPIPVHLADEDGGRQPPLMRIVPQLVIGKYRLDFALVCRSPIGIRVIGVECDGRDFHDVRRDAIRDAYLGALGIPVIRATGRQISEYPHKILARAEEYVLEWLGHK